MYLSRIKANVCKIKRRRSFRLQVLKWDKRRAGESRGEARSNISFGGPVGPENTSGGRDWGGGGGGGGGVPLQIGQIRVFILHP